MGLAGTWHCALMCGSLCAALPKARPLPVEWIALLTGRLLGYAALGAVIAAAASWGTGESLRGAGTGGSLSLALWGLAHAAALSLGLWLLCSGRQPLWWAQRSRAGQGSPAVIKWSSRAPKAASWGVVGCAWVLLPCGLLQSALVLSALASSGSAGAAVMAAFAVTSIPGLVAAPGLLDRMTRGRRQEALRKPLTRLSGALLGLASAWALGHGLWMQVRDTC